MKTAYVSSVVLGAFAVGLVVAEPSLNPAQPAQAVAAIPQALDPLIAGDYLVAAPGRVEPASEEIHVAAPLTGLLKEVLVKEGEQVRRNQVLARLESDDYEASLAKAEAQLRLSEAELERVVNGARDAERRAALAGVEEAEAVERNATAELARRRRLGAQGTVSQQSVDQAERDYAVAHEQRKAAAERYALINDPPRSEDVAIAEARVAVARAARDEAQAMLNKTIIRSPIDGTVLRVLQHPGELLTTFLSQPILTIGDLSKLYVRADVDEADIAKLETGLQAYVTADAFGDKRFPGRVIRVAQTLGKKNIRTDAPTEKTDTKILEVLIELDVPGPLRPGLRVNAFITRPAAPQTS